MEELGKALWVYSQFASDWSKGATAAQEFSMTTDHVKKYMEAFVFGDELAEFWGDYSEGDSMPMKEADFALWLAEREKKSTLAAKQANRDKQRGFYADLGATDGDNRSIEQFQVELTRAAQVIEMMLIKDHSRMKFDSQLPYDGTHEQQWRLMPVSHPEDFADFIDSVDASKIFDDDAPK
jgi:AbiV family abortive infection protein